MLNSKHNAKASQHLTIGADAEARAKKFLIDQGLAHITQNYSCTFGEIDLIMSDSNTLIFVEVRCRKNNHFGSALESITLKKQKKIMNSTQHFIQHHPSYKNWPLRFDAVGITGDDMQWVKNAF